MQLLILSVFIACCSAIQVQYRPCTYNGEAATGTVTSIDIEPLPAGGCSHTRGTLKNVCHFASNTTYNGTITFRSSETSASAKNEVKGNLGGVENPFNDVTPVDACQGSLQCPVLAGRDITYTVSVHVPVNKAGIDGVGEWRVIGDHDKAIICFLILFRIN